MSKSAKTWGVPAYKKYSLKNVTMGGGRNNKSDKNTCGNNGSGPSCVL